MVPFYLTIVNGKSYIWVESCDGEDVREDGEQAFGEEATHYQLTDDSMRSWCCVSNCQDGVLQQLDRFLYLAASTAWAEAVPFPMFLFSRPSKGTLKCFKSNFTAREDLWRERDKARFRTLPQLSEEATTATAANAASVVVVKSFPMNLFLGKAYGGAKTIVTKRIARLALCIAAVCCLPI